MTSPDQRRQLEAELEIIRAQAEAIQQIDWDLVYAAQSVMEELAQSVKLAVEAFHLQAEIDRIVAAFRTLELIPAPSMGTDFIQRVTQAVELGEDPAAIQARVQAQYDADDSAVIQRIVAKLSQNPVFSGRASVLSQALAAHRAGLDAIACYPLVAMVEGVMADYLHDYVGIPEPGHRHMAEGLLQAPAGPIAESAAVFSTEDFFRSHLYARFLWREEDEATRHAAEQLNRHQLLHGHSFAGTRLNTIRSFQILEVLGDVLGALWVDDDTSAP